ncbi:VOC family protein [Cereibacter sphaeroides]|nr:VOC family protein [Cereibacter sphaeroides]
MRLSHISLTARDADRLAGFYIAALDCRPRRPKRVLEGPEVGRGNGLPGCRITSIWLGFPGLEAPFLEILALDPPAPRGRPLVNEPGLGHLAFTVPDLDTAIARILLHGGMRQGEVTAFGDPSAPTRLIYLRDPEGNLIELEQPPA